VQTGRAGDPNWTPITMANAAVMFALEVGMLVALCFWGFTTGGNMAAKTLLGVGAPFIAGVLWWLFLAGGGPRYSTPTSVQVALKLALFGTAALALYGMGHPVLGIAFAALSAVAVAAEAATT
jgi:hypothetical protein